MSILRITEGENITHIEENWTVFTDEFEASAGQFSHFTAKETKIGEPAKDKSGDFSYLNDGWWSSDKDGKNKITRANIGEKVFFNIELKSELKGQPILIDLYDFDTEDDSDPISIFLTNANGSKGAEVKYLDIAEGKKIAHLPLTLSAGLERAAGLDTNDEIQLFFKCTYGDDLNVSLPKSLSNYLTVHTCDKKVINNYGDYGNCGYYRFRYNDFMQRHKDCIHVPPVYYYGPMLKMNGETTEFYESKGVTAEMRANGLSPEKIKMENKQGYEAKPLPSYSYGYKYCIRFSKILMPKLSDKGKKWLKEARKKLQILMDEGVIRHTYEAEYDDVNFPVLKFKQMEDTFNKNFDPSEDEIKNAEGDYFAAKIIKKENYFKNIELINNRFQEFAFATHPDAYNPKAMSELPIGDLMLISLSPDFREWLGEGAIATILQARIVAGEIDPVVLAKSNADYYIKYPLILDLLKVKHELQQKIESEAFDVIDTVFTQQNIDFIKSNTITHE